MIIQRKLQSGLSLIELMVALTLGLFVLGVAVTVFLSTSRSFRDLQKSGEQIENGRYATTLLADEVSHAGFFGRIGNLTPTGTIDPCDEPTLTNLLPVQLISAPDYATKASPPGCLDADEVSPGSDILVVRRADTNPVTGAEITDVPYIQANPVEAAVHLGGAIYTPYYNKDGITPAPVRRLHVHIYYVSPCSQETCGAGGGDGVPTLKRLELTTAGTTPAWATVPLVSGIQAMQIDVGVDTAPTGVSVPTGMRGDGAADGAFIDGTSLTTAADWSEVVSLRAYLLARTVESVIGHDDSGRTYAMGTAGNLAGTGAYKRRVFTTEIRLNDVAGRRERLVGE